MASNRNRPTKHSKQSVSSDTTLNTDEEGSGFHKFHQSTGSNRVKNAKIGKAPANEIAPFTGYGTIINQRSTNQNIEGGLEASGIFEKSLSLTNIVDQAEMTTNALEDKTRRLSNRSVEDKYGPIDVGLIGKKDGRSQENMGDHSMEVFPKMVVPPFLLPSVSDLREIGAETSEGTALIAPSSGIGFSSMTKKQVLTVVMMCFANFCSTVLFSMIAPFFPREAAMKGATQTEIGLIFGVFELTIFLTSPFYGRYITVIGPKFLYSSGLFVTGCAAILFGLLNMAPAGNTFIGLCFAVRIAEALGDAAFITASFTIIANQFPTRVSTMIGLLETFSGLGFTVGPAIGGLLYELGGFGLPFFLAGALLLCAGALSVPFIAPQRFVPADRGSIFRLLKIPSVIMMNLGVMVAAISFGFIDPTLQPHLEQFNLSVALIGVMFLCISAVYTFTAPLWGYFLDKKGYGKQVMILGALLFAFGYLFLGPTPFFHLPSKLWIVAMGMVLIGFGCGALFIPPFSECIKAAKNAGISDNFQLYGNVSGLFQSSMSLGAFLGPTVGGALVDQIGFNWSATVVAGVHVCYMIILIIFLLFERRRTNRLNYSKVTDEYDEF